MRSAGGSRIMQWGLMSVLVLASLTAAAARAAAQPAPQSAPGPAVDASDGLSPQEVQRLFDAYALVQVQEQLGLADDQYGRFLTRLKALQELRRQHLRDRDRLIRELARLTQPRATATDADLKTHVDELDQVDATAATELRKAYAQIDELLDTRQRARFRVFESAMERRKLDLLLRARQGRPLAPRRNANPR